LTPSIDHLFDRCFIGFEDSGRLVISPVAHLPSLQRMGIGDCGTRRGERRFPGGRSFPGLAGAYTPERGYAE
jgi:hypothetical protein